jgi:predicted PilT family ATPase
LIYERQKDLPIRIINENKKEKEIDNYYIRIEDRRDELKKYYDVSRLSNNLDEEELNKYIFYDRVLDETFSRKSTKEIEKNTQINKELFNKIFEENNTFLEKNDEYQD